MSRYDRDEFITVVLDNVVEGFVDQYVKETNETTTNYGFTYDYGSIMHYGAASASHNKKPTMVANDTRYQESMGSQIISFIDKSMINDHYNCKAKCPNATSAKCVMEDSLIHETALNVFVQAAMVALFATSDRLDAEIH
ncbi:astacin [Cooperia oncophora]